MSFELTSQETDLFLMAHKGNLAPLIEYMFDTPFSGTYFTPEDREEQYEVLYDAWVEKGRPDFELEIKIDDRINELKVIWEPYYGSYPMFLLRHGYRVLDWIKPIVSPATTRGIATTGTGSGKTSNVAVVALTYCLIYPGFGFLNGGPTQHQSEMMLNEAEKWTLNARFARFITMRKGANPLWKSDPYPTITVTSPVNPSIKSEFACQTIGDDANNILGTGQDWINIDETQLVRNMMAAEPKIATRMRGTRQDGRLRWSKITCISNPGDNIDFETFMEKYQDLAKKHPDRIVVMENVDASENMYITKRQLREMTLGMSDADEQRWIGGSRSAIMSDATISVDHLERCRDPLLEERVNKIAQHREDVGIMEYELPYEPGHTYIILGDVGKSRLANLSSMNIPTIMVFDITDFLERPHPLVAFAWMDGGNTYKTWTDKFRYYIMKYHAIGYYDAGNVQSALEDVGPFRELKDVTDAIYFSGKPGTKRWALAVMQILISRGVFAWPKIKALWYQAKIYRTDSKKIPDDIMATLLLFAMVMGKEGTLWNRFIEVYRADYDEAKDTRVVEEQGFSPKEELEQPAPASRYARVLA